LNPQCEQEGREDREVPPLRPSRASCAKSGVLGAAVIVLATTWVYWPAFRGSWLWDDGLEIGQNALVRAPGGWWKPWVDRSSMDYFPLKSTLQWVQWHLWGDNVLGYHLTNVALHALSALLLWHVLGKLGVRVAFLGGLLFAVHPLAVESVAWISEFKNTLSLPFLLLAMLAWMDWERRRGILPRPDGGNEAERLVYVQGKSIESSAGVPPAVVEIAGGTPALLSYILSLVCFLAAMLAKSSVVMFPVILLLYAWWRRGRVGRRDLMAAAPFFLVSLALGSATIWFQSHRAIGLAGTPESFAARLAQAGGSILLYFRDGVFPFHLAPIYPRWLVGPPTLLQFWPWAVIAVGFLALIISGFRSQPSSFAKDAVFGLGWFLLFLLPVLGLIPMAYLRVAPRADHLAYVPLVGLVGLATAGIENLNRKGGKSGKVSDASLRSFPPFLFSWPGWIVLAAVVALAVESHRYAGIFRDERSLWSFAVERNPDAWLARNNLGRILLEAGRPAEAADQLREAVRLQPDSAEAHANLGNALEKSGLAEEARGEYAAAVRIDPGFADAHYDLGLSHLLAGRPAEAVVEFRAAVRDDPGKATAHNNLGLALYRLGRIPEAIEAYQRALQLAPDLPEAHLNLGNAYFRLGRLDEAVSEYREALRLAPGYFAAHNNLGHALERLGREQEAKAELDEAARLESGR